MQDRLWVTEPRRRTCLAQVTALAGPFFALDRCLFAPTSRAHRHPQPADSGVLWIDGGEKRNLAQVKVRADGVWYRLHGTVPPRGATLNCQLDQDRRDAAAQAHTALHLMLAASRGGDGGAVPLAADPEVKGGGTFRLEFAQAVAPKRLAGWLAQANGWAQEPHRIVVEHVVRGIEARSLDAQAFDPPDPFPGPPDVLDAVRIEGVCAYPCDGTLLDTTGPQRMGRIEVTQAHQAGRRFVVACRVR